jgi:3-deoxy-7-phosphoheptulonate synthase
MIIVMHSEASTDEVGRVVAHLQDLGADVRVKTNDGITVVEASTETLLHEQAPWSSLPGVDRVVPSVAGGRRVGREHHPSSTVIAVGDLFIGDGSMTVVAGPCAIEGRDQMVEAALAVKAAGADVLRGDAFKPRTSPYSFQGLGKAGLEILSEASALSGLPTVAEVLDPRHVDLVSSYADILRIGTRNMSNQALLREVGQQEKPVQLKRGRASTIEEWIDAAEHIHDAGNPNIILVERGIRGFDHSARNTLDITAIPLAKALTHLPVMVDPSHAAGRRDLVRPLALAAVAAGADGIMIDVHPHPDRALVDGNQALRPSEFEALVVDMTAVAKSLRDPGSNTG